MAKLSALGVTVLASSGDSGVSQPGLGGNCSSDSSSSSSGWAGSSTWSGKGYFPSFPASSPYVTAVGATMGLNGYAPAVGTAEVGCDGHAGGVITTGGGFSTFYATPSWQSPSVASYFGNLSRAPAAGYNPQGRGIPDVSMVGVRYQTVVAGSVVSLFGTSASAPVLAGFVSLVNAARVSKGLPLIGWINPTLYSNKVSHQRYWMLLITVTLDLKR